MEIDPQIRSFASEQPYPLMFVTISGAHLYGFPSADSDYDLRGVHVLPVREVVGLDAGRETIEVSTVLTGAPSGDDASREDRGSSVTPTSATGGRRYEIDLVTHDVRKFFLLLLKKNGYVLEQLYSPLVLHTTPEYAELKRIAAGCITKHHAHHYLGFARTQWRLFEKGQPRRVKPLLYVYRVLLTGIHLMRTGRVEANLVRLNETFKLNQIDELIAQKVGGSESSPVEDADLNFHAREHERLTRELESASDASSLPDGPTARGALNEMLVRLRTA